MLADGAGLSRASHAPKQLAMRIAANEFTRSRASNPDVSIKYGQSPDKHPLTSPLENPSHTIGIHSFLSQKPSSLEYLHLIAWLLLNLSYLCVYEHSSMTIHSPYCGCVQLMGFLVWHNAPVNLDSDDKWQSSLYLSMHWNVQRNIINLNIVTRIQWHTRIYYKITKIEHVSTLHLTWYRIYYKITKIEHVSTLHLTWYRIYYKITNVEHVYTLHLTWYRIYCKITNVEHVSTHYT